MIKPNTRVRHIVTRSEGVVIDTYRAARMGGKITLEYVRVKLSGGLQREWRTDKVETVSN